MTKAGSLFDVLLLGGPVGDEGEHPLGLKMKIKKNYIIFFKKCGNFGLLPPGRI